jgi:hypothetical protein
MLTNPVVVGNIYFLKNENSRIERDKSLFSSEIWILHWLQKFSTCLGRENATKEN